MKSKIEQFDRNFNTKTKVYKVLSAKEKAHLEKFVKKVSVKSKSNNNINTYVREILRFRYTMEISFFNVTDESLDDYMILLGKAGFSDYTFNKVVMCLNRFLKYTYKDWSSRFNNLESVVGIARPQNKNQKTEKNLINQENAEKLIRASPSLLRKTLLLVHKQTGARTGELVRGKEVGDEGRDCFPLTWDRVEHIEQDRVRITLTSIKGGEKKRRIITLGNQAAHYLEMLKKEQKKKKKLSIKRINERITTANNKGDLKIISRMEDSIEQIENNNYVFTSDRNYKTAMGVSNYGQWFGDLCELVLERRETPYIFRHTMVTELDRKVKAGTMTKDIALKIMGHTEKMFDRVYSKITPNEIADEIEKQLFIEEDIEYTAEEEVKLKDKVESMEKVIDMLKNAMFIEQRAKEGKGKILKLKGGLK